MIAMIFEFWFDPDDPARYQEYLAESARLRELLPGVAGLEGIERFQSTTDPHRYVAIASFDDEASVAVWRRDQDHRRAQELGRSRFFAGYRLRMAEVVRDYGKQG
ncbi:antibiotic biosynthesis monooxygenase family protein [Catenuloplanes sp. NPDC051500]|uniref:antibiotic biosynthesis monooxygenase family protein n=1 Tax=Catenuloplanes sp. NPDC051500 TaxID=3363959 RepID=UPI0037A7D013